MATVAASSFLSTSPNTPSPFLFFKVTSISLPIRVSRNRYVKAMGVLKYKGTQMREKKLTELIEKKVLEAKEVCQGDEKSDGCKVAWDEVEEISQAKADLRRRLEKEDPLEYFCSENPETDECRIYED
ncbi:hypothetical protein IFM89_024793 [Coptis chinensis]|uniref:CP12 domain-containing protein n=1 Tax=Coptis chinensis TaxID=261450 RepID=A0A835LWJ0_9MAGN|nr:hypothetical protein IFM89_024793 [Coptis chinensis]